MFWKFAFLTGLIVVFVYNPGQADEPQITGVDHLLNDTRLQELGEKLFFDENLSKPKGQSCATCHGAEAG